MNEPGSVSVLREAAPEEVAVCAIGQLIGADLLAQHEMLNVHPSLIPRWRGAAPIERAMMAGDERTGTTILRVSEGLDSGPVALQEQLEIEPGEYFDELASRLAGQGGELLVRALDLREAGDLELTEQDEAAATYAEKISPEERRLDPGTDAAELAWKVRALNPHIGTYLELEGGGRLGVRRASPVEEAPPAGQIAEREDSLILGTAKAGLLLEVVQPPGGRAMPAAEFLRGHPVPGRAISRRPSLLLLLLLLFDALRLALDLLLHEALLAFLRLLLGCRRRLGRSGGRVDAELERAGVTGAALGPRDSALITGRQSPPEGTESSAGLPASSARVWGLPAGRPFRASGPSSGSTPTWSPAAPSSHWLGVVLSTFSPSEMNCVTKSKLRQFS